MEVTVRIGKEKYVHKCTIGLNEVRLLNTEVEENDGIKEIIFNTNYSWKPSERMESTDQRNLGVALVDIK